MDFRRSLNCGANAFEPNGRQTETKEGPEETNFSWNGPELGAILRSCKSTSEKKCETYRCRRVPFRPFVSKVKVREKTLLASLEQSGGAAVFFKRFLFCTFLLANVGASPTLSRVFTRRKALAFRDADADDWTHDGVSGKQSHTKASEIRGSY